MYSASLEKTLGNISALKRYILTSDAFRSAVHEQHLICRVTDKCFDLAKFSRENAPERLDWKVIDHCAVVTRIYAIYEQFAQEMLREHLGILQKHVSFDALPAELHSAYRRGLATILEKKDGPRFGHLHLPSLITQYGMALSGQSFTLEPLALLIQEQNLRMGELSRLFAANGISNITSWIDQHPSIKDFFSAEGRLGGTCEHEMLELIKYRNDAAHGSITVDDILGISVLIEFCDFISAVCEAIFEGVQKKGIEILIDANIAYSLGKVTECIKEGKVIIGNLEGSFAVGDTIYLSGEGYCWEREILEIRCKDQSMPTVLTEESTEFGILLDKKGKKNARIFIIKPEQPAANPSEEHDF